MQIQAGTKRCSAIGKHNVAYLDMFSTRFFGLSMHLDDDVMGNCGMSDVSK